MWHFQLKWQKIRAFVEISHKQLKIILALGVKKLNPTSVASKLGKFLLLTIFRFLIFLT